MDGLPISAKILSSVVYCWTAFSKRKALRHCLCQKTYEAVRHEVMEYTVKPHWKPVPNLSSDCHVPIHRLQTNSTVGWSISGASKDTSSMRGTIVGFRLCLRASSSTKKSRRRDSVHLAETQTTRSGPEDLVIPSRDAKKKNHSSTHTIRD